MQNISADSPPRQELSEGPGSSNPVLDEARAFWKRVKDHSLEKKFRTEAVKNIKYFSGEDQGWDDDGARSELEGEGRPALTLNRTHPIIRLICGSRPKIDVTFEASEQGKESTANVLAACSEYVDDDNQWKFKENELIQKALVMKRGIIKIMPNYDRDVMGEIELKLVNPYNVYLDPDSEDKDRKDQIHMIEVVNVRKEEAYRTFPGKKAEIKNFAESIESSSSNKDIARDPVDGYKDDNELDYVTSDTKKISLIYYWYKEFKTSTKIVDIATRKVNDSPMPKAEAERMIAQAGGKDRFRVIERTFISVKYLVFCHDIELERGANPWDRKDGKPTELSRNFPFVVEELDRLVFGVEQYIIDFMAMLRDPQKYHNKLASSILHIINTTAKGGYDYQNGALTPEQKRKLEEEGSKPGHLQEWEDLSKMRPRTGGAMPQAEMAIAEEMSRELLDISGVESLISTKSLGKNASGKAISQKVAQGGDIISWIYECHIFFMHQLQEYKRDAIQILYDYQKVIKIKGDRPKHVTINQKVYDSQGGITQILNDITEGKYACRIREKEDVPTMKLERFKYFTELVKGGLLQIPPPVMLKITMQLMDDPDLKEIAEEELTAFAEEQKKQMAAQAQAAAQAKKGIPPQIKEGVSIDRLFPMLARSEQVQVLQEIGIKADMNAAPSDLASADNALKARMEATREMTGGMQ